MKKLLPFLITCTLFTNLVFAQSQQTIRGKIKDTKTGEALIGATVALKGTSTGAATDYDGNFIIKTTEQPPYILVITYVGYKALEITVNDISKPLTINAEQEVTILKEAVVSDSRISERQKQNPVTVETMDALAIKQTPAANFYEGLAHLKGVDLTSASIGFKIINTRGFNSTSPVRSLQLIDGVDNQSPGLNFSLGNFLGASELDVQKVDLVVGASSAYYGPNAFNGVINMQTKSPFLYPGLSAQVKVGERSLFETAVRWAQVFKNSKGEDKFAYKLNIFHMRAYDWEATNNSVTSQSPVGTKNPGGYDAVNTYGDENVSPFFYTEPSSILLVGRGYYLREGYQEKDLVDYNSRNTKLNAAFHYKLTKDIEAIYASSFSTGTTVYQGDNRFSLKDILFFQNKIEVRKENRFFIRAYATNEDAGKSYDAYSTAIIMQNKAKSDEAWGKDYNNSLSSNLAVYMNDWYSRNLNEGLMLRNIPGANNQRLNFIENYWRTTLIDSLNYFHQIARTFASNNPSATGGNYARFVPGSVEFDSAFRSTTAKTNRDGGSRLFDQSALYHIAGEYRFKIKTFEFNTGGNFRLYAPYSKGTLFLDTGNQRIYNREAGAYIGIEKKVIDDKLKLNFTNRLDKNENFELLWSPAATAVFVYKKHIIRVSASSAIRNPTLSDQYIFLNVGRATLIGNLNGFDSLVTIGSFRDALNNGRQNLQYFNVDPIRPEKVKTLEFGYRGSSPDDKFYYDFNYYHSWYTDFIGYKIGAKVDWKEGAVLPDYYQVYRVATNAKDQVTTQGIAVGLQYFYRNYLGFSGNYSWNKLDRGGSTDSIIPAFNTPEHKYNLGINGRNITSKIGSLNIRHWGYSINYKFQTGFTFEGSPQFTGFVNSYDMVDVQINKNMPGWYCTFKLGASNVLNNKVYQVYGGPQVGRLTYFSVLFELDKWK